ncbi:serine/threonine-protein kinase [Actinoplanes oblitus]|uniref:non-specific serine/threonine protein kinase n=1 Tax=Actinoplanes oblitus TaxID=3040509 RepID=A0ABY8WP54_9ACTN|nr:serine/threonine-protein kinase [Actinoplanes oblitus]WIM98338.1 serine/threonine-protein kinase [Actinoplanes oblitus]
MEAVIIAERYRIIRPLGSGGMSHVWLARDEVRHVDVAIKQCTVPPGLRPEQREVIRTWALSEAQAAARVRHPHVIRTLDVLPDPDGPWLVMEYVPGRSLQQLIQDKGALPPARVAEIGLAVLEALGAAGRAGLLHLDVKPGNVLIGDDGRIVLIDFGPAVTTAGVAALTRARVVLGSPKYIAPERLFDRASTARSDLWSLGATLYHAVEGQPPYARGSTAATLRALAAGPPDAPRRAGPLTPVLAGLMRHDPAARLDPAATEELLRRVARPARSTIRRRMPALAAALTLIAALTVGGSAQGVENPPAPLPPGFMWWQDPAGLRLAVPTGWTAHSTVGTLTFTDPADRLTLRVGSWPHPPRDVLADLLDQERAVKLPSYRRVQIAAVPAPVWEFTYTDPKAGPTHVLRQLVDGKYLVEWRTPRADWVTSLPKLTEIRDSFG